MATINDIAKIARVSAATVSHVVNKTRFVSPELVKRVEEAIKTLDSPPNFVVKKSKSASFYSSQKYIVLLCSDSHNNFQIQIERELTNLVKAAGYFLISVDYGKDIKTLDLYSHLLLSSPNAIGLFIFPDAHENVLDKFLSTIKIPIVAMCKPIKGITTDVVLSADFEGAYKATNHLIRSGHENIAIICGDKNSEFNIERIRGYTKSLDENQIACNEAFILTGVATEEGVCKSLNAILSSPNPPTAVFVANYNNILSVFKYIETANISCPVDLSIVGFNDFDWAPLHKPPITTIAQNTKAISSNAAALLLQRITEREDEESSDSHMDPKTITVSTELIIRGSTAGIGRGPFGEKAMTSDSLQLTEIETHAIREKKVTAAISFHYTGKAWMQLHEQGIKDIFSKLGISLIATTDAHFDPDLQNKQLVSLLTLEPDILIAIPTDNLKTAPTFKKIVDSKTKLILIANVPEGLLPKDYVCCVSVNERSHGRDVGRGIGEYLTKHNLSNVGLIKHGAIFYATNQRDDAAEQILTEEYPALNICGITYFDSEESVYDKTIDLINKHPEINGLYISWEGPATKVMAALIDLDRTDIAISTADLEYPVALNLAKGGMIKSISSQCPYEQGQAIALAAANALLGKKTPSFIGLEPIYVTTDNLLKSWKKIFKTDPPEQLSIALNENPLHSI